MYACHRVTATYWRASLNCTGLKYYFKMQPWKIWNLLALLFPAYLYGFIYAVELEPCLHAIKNERCNMTCRIPDFSEIILFTCNGSTRASCSILSCAGMTKEGTDTLHLEITSLSYANDNCEWRCKYGTTLSPAPQFQIYSGISNAILTSQENPDGVKLTAIAECLYPYDPNVDVLYSEKLDGQYASLSQQVDLQSSTTPGGCSDAIERKVTAVYDVSAKHAKLEGKSVFFKMKFSQYPSGQFIYTNATGPFSFEDCFLDIFLCGFLPDSLIEVIASITIFIILKKECLPKLFGEFTRKKLGIIIAFLVIAIIIGVCLGLLIKGCDKKFLALGLSLFFGILLVVALIFALIYYHKKCESGSGS